MSTHNLYGLAAILAEHVGEDAERTAQPVPMDTIRAICRMLILGGNEYNQHRYYKEHAYYEHSQWFIRFSFPDGSDITFGDSEDV